MNSASASADAPQGLDRDFRRLWAAQGVSQFGSHVTRVALPFTAALAMHASPAQMATLAAADLVAGLAISPWAGAWLDRRRRRPVLVTCDLARAAALATVPLAALAHRLSIELLVVVMFANGALSTLFDIAQQAYLPALVGERRLVEANARMTGTESVASMGAFGLGGWLVQWFTGPIAVALDAVSFLVSAAFLRGITHGEASPAGTPARGGFTQWTHEVREGLVATFGDPVQRTLALCEGVLNLKFGVFMACYMLFVTRELALPTGPLGMIFALGGISALAGSVLASRLGQRLGRAWTMAGGLLAGGVGLALTTVAPRERPGVAMTMLALQQLVGDGGWAVFLIHAGSLRMELAPEALRGRIGAASRFLSLASMLVGVAAGAALAARIGLRPTLMLGAISIVVAIALVLGRPMRAQAKREVHASLEVQEP